MAVSRVIEVSFGRSSVALARIDTAYFYNNGILFKPTDIDLPASYQVHWADSPQATSTLETIGTAEGAPIPDDLWGRSRVIYGWIYLHPTNDSSVTGYEVRIYKNVRAGLPDGTEPTPAEQSTIDQLISALNSAVEQTGEDAESAEQARDDAITARNNAQGFAENAQSSAQASARSAESASQSAQTASENATASAQSASASAQIKSDIEGMVDDAQGYAQASAQSATASANSATTAQGYANTASASAQSASTSASNASTSAQTASTKASEASTSAQTASAKATEASQSATNASQSAQTAEQAKTASQTAQGLAESARDTAVSAKTDAESARDDAVQAKEDAESVVASISGALAEKAPVITDTASGAIASFTDGADDLPLKSLVVNIDPVQDLHGQDAPWPAGGGKNLLPPIETITNNGITFSQSGDYININGTATANAYVMLFSGVLPSGDYVINGMTGAGNSTWRVGIKIGDASWVYASGGERTFTSDGTTTIMVYLFAYPAYGAFDNLKVQYQLERGTTPTAYAPYENLCPISGWTQIGVEQSGVNVWDEEWETVAGVRIGSKNYIPVVPNATYYFGSATGGLFSNGIRFYDLNKTQVGVIWNGGAVTIPSNAYFCKFFMSNSYGTTYNHDISINYPSTDHSYHPYTGRSITIQFGQTVYGGKVDVLSGELTVDRAIVDLGTLTWLYISANGFFQSNSLSDAKSYAVGTLSTIRCSMLPTKSAYDVYTLGNGIGLDRKFLRVAYPNMPTDSAEFKTTVTGQKVLYELATPITIQLTPNQVNSLLGVNNIWADSGDTEAEYRADTKLYIAKKIAEAIASLT